MHVISGTPARFPECHGPTAGRPETVAATLLSLALGPATTLHHVEDALRGAKASLIFFVESHSPYGRGAVGPKGYSSQRRPRSL